MLVLQMARKMSPIPILMMLSDAKEVGEKPEAGQLVGQWHLIATTLYLLHVIDTTLYLLHVIDTTLYFLHFIDTTLFHLFAFLDD